MHLCADKDATMATFKLKQKLLNKKPQLLICKSQLEEKIAQWRILRDNACDKAIDDYRNNYRAITDRIRFLFPLWKSVLLIGAEKRTRTSKGCPTST